MGALFPRSNRYSLSRLTALSLVVLVVVLNLFNAPSNILSWDVFGYYLYLPQLFLHNDLALHDVDRVLAIIEQYNNTASFYQAAPLPDGRYVMKYSMGMALLYLPFFLLGHAGALLTGAATDGFSAPYQVALFAGSMVYTVSGIVLLRRMLAKLFTERLTAVVLLVLVLGTNLLFHTAFHGQNAMSHNYLFTLYAGILLLTASWHRSPRWSTATGLAVLCGLTILARPSEIVCLLLPVCWGVYNRTTLREKWQRLWQQRNQVLAFALILLAIGSLQFIYWKWATGKFLYYSYGANAGEGFEFFRPYIAELLFSYRKGWLLYTPLMGLGLVGLVAVYRQQRALLLPLLAFTALNLYIVSSWSNWWYAESFSQRSLIQSYAVLALPLGFALQAIGRWSARLRFPALGLISLLVGLNLFQTWQMDQGILHPSRMTKAYYWKVFGRTSTQPQDQQLLLIDRHFDGPERFTAENTHEAFVLQSLALSEPFDRPDTAANGRLDGAQEFLEILSMPYDSITANYYAWIRTSARVYPSGNPAENPTSLVVTFEHNGYPYKYRSLELADLNLEPGQWHQVTLDYLTPEVRSGADRLKVYFWHRGQATLFVDDVSVVAYEPEPK